MYHFFLISSHLGLPEPSYRVADKSLVRPGRKQTRKHVRDARDFNNIETRVVIKFFFSLQGKAPKEIYAILTETLVCLLPCRGQGLISTHVMTYSKVKVKSDGDKASPCFKPFVMANLSDKFERSHPVVN